MGQGPVDGLVRSKGPEEPGIEGWKYRQSLVERLPISTSPVGKEIQEARAKS